MKTVAFYNLKGGVGKTAAAVNLAYLAARSGLPTLLWDLDPQAAATWYLGVETGFDAKAKKLLKGKAALAKEARPTRYTALEVLPADADLRHWDAWLDRSEEGDKALRQRLRPLKDAYQLLVLDCPPTFSHLSENVIRAADLVLAPIIPTPLSLRAWEQIHAYFGEKKYGRHKLVPFFSMVDRRRKLHRQWLEAPPQVFAAGLRAWIPYASQVEQMGVQGEPVPCFAPRAPVAAAYQALWLEVAQRLSLPVGEGGG